MPQSGATKASRKQANAAAEAFHKHYASERNWGQRWEASLYSALARPTRHAALVNQFASQNSFLKSLQEAGKDSAVLETIILPSLNGDITSPPLLCYQTMGEKQTDPSQSASGIISFPNPTASSVVGKTGGLLTHWNLDAASVLCAHLLDIQPRDRVLDLCAAPGGKSVALAQRVWPELHHGSSDFAPSMDGCLHSNELDSARQKRMANNLQSYLPSQLIETGLVKALRVDASQPAAVQSLPLGANGYDRVLVDAPCSSERHVIHAQIKAERSNRNADELMRWRPGSSKPLAKTQAAILMTALRAVRAGGRVVYATCSIETLENDGVIDKVLELLQKEHKKSGVVWHVRIHTGSIHEGETEQTLDSWSERTKHGRICLPDHPSGHSWGPLFFCVLTKLPA